jgi:hypothetical protein
MAKSELFIEKLRIQNSEFRRQETGDRRQETGDRGAQSLPGGKGVAMKYSRRESLPPDSRLLTSEFRILFRYSSTVPVLPPFAERVAMTAAADGEASRGRTTMIPANLL